MCRPRIGIFGGTFDPIHIGHLAVAERAGDELHLNQVVFVPALRPPHKSHRQVSSMEDRLAMLKMAIAENDRFSWSDADMISNEPSYTVTMLERIDRQFAGSELFFIIGEDSLRDFGKWYQPGLILKLTRLAVAARPGVVVAEELYQQVPGLRERVVRFPAPLLEVSSTALRNRVFEGKSIRYLVPTSVYEYVHEHRLYLEPDTQSDDSNGNDVQV